MSLILFRIAAVLILIVPASAIASTVLEQKISLINKWHYELYSSENFESLAVLLNACVNDPVVEDLIGEQGFSKNWTSESVLMVSDWALTGIAHTQFLDEFKNNPGKDPWGAIDHIPTYKKLLPGEMLAMEKFSTKYTGKCTSITHLVFAVFRKLGMGKRDCAVLRLDGHTIAIVKVGGACFLIDNNRIQLLTELLIDEVLEYEILGFYTDGISYKGRFKLDRDMMTSESCLVDSIIDKASIDESKISSREQGGDYMEYALQSLHVADPDLYVDASVRGPLVLELSKDLNDVDSTFRWIEENVKQGHVLGTSDRIQTADQTIVFKVGNHTDVGLLVLSILRIRGNDAELKITGDDAYLIQGSRVFSIKNRSEINEVEGVVHLHLR